MKAVAAKTLIHSRVIHNLAAQVNPSLTRLWFRTTFRPLGKLRRRYRRRWPCEMAARLVREIGYECQWVLVIKGEAHKTLSPPSR
jgi:hypothetical protein